LFGISFFLDENFNISENNIILAKDSSDSRRPKIPLNPPPPQTNTKKRTMATQVGPHRYLWRVVAKPSHFFLAKLIDLVKRNLVMAKHIYIYFVGF
jgi:hypothetical protein